MLWILLKTRNYWTKIFKKSIKRYKGKFLNLEYSRFFINIIQLSVYLTFVFL